jgi:hypothetical protein
VMVRSGYKLAVALPLVLIAGLVYSHVCALECLVDGCRQDKAKAETGHERPGHCGNQMPDSPPSDHGQPSDCAGYAGLSLLLSSSLTSVQPDLDSPPECQSPPSPLLSGRPEVLAAGPETTSFRAPPLLSALRI